MMLPHSFTTCTIVLSCLPTSLALSFSDSTKLMNPGSNDREGRAPEVFHEGPVRSSRRHTVVAMDAVLEYHAADSAHSQCYTPPPIFPNLLLDGARQAWFALLHALLDSSASTFEAA